MNSIYKQKNDEYRPLIDGAIEAALSDRRIPALLSESMLYSVRAGGKRVRPCMLLAACELGGGNILDALPLAAGIEMIHTYSLIHDDLPCMDDDDIRRGMPTNHKRFGEGNAVLAGDGLLTHAFYVMTEAAVQHCTANPRYTLAVNAIAFGAGVCGMVSGQSLDLMLSDSDSGTLDELKAMQSGKTGALIKAALIAGGHASVMDDAGMDALSRFGELYGALFQMTDDLLDATSPENAGQAPTRDEEQHKLTYPSLLGWDETLRLVGVTAADAMDALSVFDERADYFREMVTLTVGRKK